MVRRSVLLRMGLSVCVGLLPASGCGKMAPVDGPSVWGEPVVPMAVRTEADTEVGSGRCPADKVSDRKKIVADMLLFYVSSGRDFREPAGLDGYVIRVVPLDKKFRPVRVDGTVEIVLARESGPPGTAKVLRRWRIGPEGLEEYWLQTSLLDGYAFRLDWGENDPGVGMYRLVVKLNYRGKKVTEIICRELVFDDLQARTEAKSGN